MKIKERNKIVEENYGLVYFVIDKYFSNKPNKDDMFQEGVIGLIQAVENYDKNVSAFSSYAIPMIKYTIQRFVKMDNPVYTPQWVGDALIRYNKAKRKIFTETGRVPTHEQICKVIKVKPKRMSEAISARTLFTIDVNEDEAPIDIIDDNSNEIFDKEMETIIEKELQMLDERSRDFVIKNFYEKMSIYKIGEIYGISGARVHQVISTALKKMRENESKDKIKNKRA